MGDVLAYLIPVLTLVLLLTIAVSFTAALLAWRERPEPGATPLFLLLSGAMWWTAFLVFELRADSLGRKILYSNVQWIGVVVIPVAWAWFALEYTGRDKYVKPKILATLSIVPLLTILLALTDPYHSLLYLDTTLVTENGVSLLDRTPGPGYWLITGYTYLLGIVGIIPLLDLIRSDAVPFRGQSHALIIGMIAPWLSNFLFLTGRLPLGKFDPTPIAFTITGVAFLGAVTRFRLFGTSPAPTLRARRLIFDRLSDGAIVVDSNDNIVDLNESAESLLEEPREEALGATVDDFMPALQSRWENGSTPDYVTIDTPGGTRSFDVTVTRVQDIHDRDIGRVITFHDVGEYLRQQQRLEVLNRVFRHNIRTETQIIIGYADQMADDSQSDLATILQDRARKITDLGDKVRTIIDLFEQGRNPGPPVSLESVLDECINDFRRTFPDTSLRIPDRPENVSVSPVLEPVIWNALENAAEHNTNSDPAVEMEIETTSECVRVSIADNGPGLSENEYRVLERGTETPLEHVSGLGLWLIYWGADIAGGSVSFDSTESKGSVVTIHVPRIPQGEGDC